MTVNDWLLWDFGMKVDMTAGRCLLVYDAAALRAGGPENSSLSDVALRQDDNWLHCGVHENKLSLVIIQEICSLGTGGDFQVPE